MDEIGPYQEHEFPKSRTATIDTVEMGMHRHHVPFLLEVDVTAARSRLRDLKEKTGESLSFTGWVTKCIAQAVSEYPYVHALRKGKKMIVFEDVDISVVVERARPSEGESEKEESLPMPYVIRKANQKSLKDIHDEIRAAQIQPVGKSVYIGADIHSRKQGVFFSLPQSVRKLLFWRRLVSDPFFAKKTMGTVVVTSVGSHSKRGIGSFWAIPVGIHSLVVALGGIVLKPGVVGDFKVEIREYLCLTVLFDHDVTDGAPVARFIGRLSELMESSYGLL